MTRKERRDYVSLLKEEGLYREAEPTSFKKLLIQYSIFSVLFLALVFFAADFYDGKWAETKEAVVVQRHTNKFGVNSPKTIRVETDPQHETYWINTGSSASVRDCPSRTLVQSYRGGFTNFRYSVRLLETQNGTCRK